MTAELHEFCTARVRQLDESLGAYFTKRMADECSRTDLLVHVMMEALPPYRRSLPGYELNAIDYLTSEIAAKGRILARHRPLSQAAPQFVYFNGSNAHQCHGCGDSGQYEPDTYPTAIDDCPELRDLAAPYGWHFDYKARWRPQ